MLSVLLPSVYMTNTKRSAASDRSPSSKAKGKRKLSDLESSHNGTLPVTPKGHKNIAKHFSESQDIYSDSDEPITPSKRSKRRHGCPARKGYSRTNGAGISSATMYSFPPAKSKPDHCPTIDLTGSTPPSSPQNGRMRNKSSGQNGRTTVTFNPHAGPKKLIVKNLRTAPRVDPEQYFERTWGQIDMSLTAVFLDRKPSYSLEELYRGAENVCRQGRAAELYRRTIERCRDHLASRVREELKRRAIASADTELLKAFVDAWARWSKQLKTVRSIFYYMDQTYSLRSVEHPNVTEAGLQGFRSIVFYDDMLKPKILDGITELVDVDRDGKLDDGPSDLLREAVETLLALDVYTPEFVPAFRKSSEAYFRPWRDTDAEREGLAHYAESCTKFFEREMERCALYKLDQNTRSQLTELFEDILVEQMVELLVDDDSVTELLKQDRSSVLEQVYSLLHRRGHHEELGDTFNAYIVAEGQEIVFDEKREADMVINLLDFKRRLDHISKYSFHGNERMDNGMHKSFEYFINKTQKTQANWDTDNAKPGEMIAKHVDVLLKGGVKAVPKLATAKKESKTAEEEHDFDDGPADEDAEINLHLSNALDLFRFVHGKAVFEAFYKKDLARRLLMARSASNDAERGMLQRLKNECGAGFTHNLESMFKDMDLARDEMASYNQLLDDRGTRPAMDLGVNVLSAAAWPTYPDVSVTIPTSILKIMSDFETHYNMKHNGRKLTWKHALAHCQLKAKFPKGNKEIVVSGFQAIVLLLFNDADSISYTDIQAASGLSEAELKRTLQSLACAKYRVLSKSPKGRDVNETDTFAFNAGFADQKLRIKINQIQLKETKEENKETHQRVAADRHYETQAAIVRIMKSRKTIRHVELISEVIKATKSRGVLDPADIKKNIEKFVLPRQTPCEEHANVCCRLIEKDYMERGEGNTYDYVA